MLVLVARIRYGIAAETGFDFAKRPRSMFDCEERARFFGYTQPRAIECGAAIQTYFNAYKASVFLRQHLIALNAFSRKRCRKFVRSVLANRGFPVSLRIPVLSFTSATAGHKEDEKEAIHNSVSAESALFRGC